MVTINGKAGSINKPHKHSALIKAWADGAVIEIEDPHTGKWVYHESPGWVLNCKYRVKPEPKPDIISNAMMQFQADWKRPVVVCNWNGEVPAGYAHNLDRKDLEHIQFTFDGETGELKSVEMIK